MIVEKNLVMEILYDIYLKFGARESSPKTLAYLPGKKSQAHFNVLGFNPASLYPDGRPII
jgi:hypothetical protein